jgi:hypothetical protein
LEGDVEEMEGSKQRIAGSTDIRDAMLALHLVWWNDLFDLCLKMVILNLILTTENTMLI